MNKEEPIQTAYEIIPFYCEWDETRPSLAYGDTPEEAIRHHCDLNGLDRDEKALDNFHVRRAPAYDLFAPVWSECLNGLSEKKRQILLETYRKPMNQECCAPPDNLDCLALVEAGFMIGPLIIPGALPKGNAYFYLTQKGRAAAASMLPRRRGKTESGENHEQ